MPVIRRLLQCASAAALMAASNTALGQTALPEIIVHEPKPAAEPTPASTVASDFAIRTQTFDQARDYVLPKIGTDTYQFNQQAIEALPQGDNTPVDKLLLQAPGVTQDSAASGLLHVRNEHANVQYRINGILLPDGVAGFAQILETGFVGNLALITGALPAQYGFHTAGLVDITTRSGLQPGGSVSIYGGSRQTITPSFEYGGTVGQTEYFVTGRYFESGEGIENPTSSLNAIHDYTVQGKFFGYMSTLLDETTRVSAITGVSVNQFQIPNSPGQTPFSPLPDGFPVVDSTQINERQLERNYYNVLALQRKLNDVDLQLAYFSRYSSLHFVPDPVGDVDYNGAATDVFRSSLLHGIEGDMAWRINEAHTLRTGFYVSGEQTKVDTSAVAVVLDDSPTTTNIYDTNSKLGWLLGTYVQDEWKITDQLTLNAGLRFDQMYQYVDANQFSPRVSLVYKPLDGTTIHAGYARYFTPPSQALAAEPDLALYTATNNALTPAITQSSPVLPERSHYFDAGVDQKLLPGLTVGIDAYYKIARDLLDDGQFGQALLLTAFNYDKAFNDGVELKATYQNGNFSAYGNIAWARQVATDIVSNQSLFGPDELAYIATHYIYTDHAQLWTGSAGMSYLWEGTRYSADMIYGSGLRNGFANIGTVPPYTQFNLGVSHEFASPVPGLKPLTVRFDIVNVFDTIYEIRDGTGIGVFAPQFGPRCGYFVGLSQQL